MLNPRWLCVAWRINGNRGGDLCVHARWPVFAVCVYVSTMTSNLRFLTMGGAYRSGARTRNSIHSLLCSFYICVGVHVGIVLLRQTRTSQLSSRSDEHVPMRISLLTCELCCIVLVMLFSYMMCYLTQIKFRSFSTCLLQGLAEMELLLKNRSTIVSLGDPKRLALSRFLVYPCVLPFWSKTHWSSVSSFPFFWVGLERGRLFSCWWRVRFWSIVWVTLRFTSRLTHTFGSWARS